MPSTVMMDGVEPFSCESVKKDEENQSLEDTEIQSLEDTDINNRDLGKSEVNDREDIDLVNDQSGDKNCAISEEILNNSESIEQRETQDQDTTSTDSDYKEVSSFISNENTSQTEMENCASENVHCTATPVVAIEDSVQTALAKFSRTYEPIASPLSNSSSCKKAHSATDSFLNNLKAKKSQCGTRVNILNRCKTDSLLFDNESSAYERSSQNGNCENVEIIYETSELLDKSDCGKGDSLALKKENTPVKVIMCEEYNTSNITCKRKLKKVSFNMQALRESVQSLEKKMENQELIRKFRAQIAPSDNTAAEDELRREISKDMFAKVTKY